MSTRTARLLGNARGLSSAKSRAVRLVPRAAGLTALAAILLAAPGAARAAIVMTNSTSAVLCTSGTVGRTSGYSGAYGSSTMPDVAISATEPFTVPANTSVLVVQYDEYAVSDIGSSDANPTISWNGAPLKQAISQVGSASGYPFADIFYLFNPTSGTGGITFSAYGCSAAFGAMTLSGVNTGIAPICSGGNGVNGTTTASAVFSGANAVAAPGSFAVVDEGCRAQNPSNNDSFQLGATGTGVAAGQPWNYSDSCQYDAGGGTVANIPAGALTITATQSDVYKSVATRNVIAAAVFTPALSSGTWTGATNGNWSLSASDNNWGGTPYSDASSVTFPDISGKPSQNITVAAGGVQPAIVTFVNNATAYAFSGGPIAGPAVVALNGAGSVTFSSSNSYYGGTTINGGTLTAANNAALGAGPVTVNPPGTLGLVTAAPAVNGLSGGGNVVLGNAAGPSGTNLTLGTGGNATFSGAIAEAAAGLGSVTMAGIGTQTLSGVNTYSGGTTVQAGNLVSASQYSLGAGPIVLSGGTLSVVGPASYSNNLSLGATLYATGGGGAVAFTGSTTLTGAATLNVDPGMSLTLAGPVGDGGTPRTVTVSGGGAVVLTTANTFTAGTNFQVNTGSLVAVGQSYTAPGPATGPLGSAAITLNNGTLALASTSTAPATFDLVSGNAVTLSASSNDTLVAGSALAGDSNGAFVLAGSNAFPVAAGQTLTLGATNGYALTVSPGLVFSNSGTLSFGPGSVSLQQGSLAGPGAVNLNALAVLTVSTSGFPAPTLNVNSGSVLAGNVAAAFAFAGTNAIAVNGQLQVAADGGLNSISQNVVMGAGGQYDFTVPQSTSPTLTVPAGAGLFGNLTHFTYGSTGSVTLAANSTLSPSAIGTLPTRAQLGGAILLAPVLAADTGSYTVGDNGSTSIYKGVSLGSWTTVGGVPIGNGVPFTAANGTYQFTNLPAVNFSAAISDSAGNGFTFYLNGQNVTLSTAASLNTTNTAMGVEFDGLGNVSFPAGANPGGTATVYSRVGVFDYSNTSNNTLPNTTGNTFLITLQGTNNLAGATLNLENLRFAVSVANYIASTGTVNFGAFSSLYNTTTDLTQGTFNFAPTALFRVRDAYALTSGATFNFQSGALVEIAYSPVDTDSWAVPSNVDLVLGVSSTATGMTGIVLGDGRTLSTPSTNQSGPYSLTLSAGCTLNTTAGTAHAVRLAGANGQVLTINGPLDLANLGPSGQLLINDLPSNTLYVNGYNTSLSRTPGGSVLNGTVVLSNTTGQASIIPAVVVNGGTLQLASPFALGTSPLPVTVGASTANATTATLDLDGNNLAVSSLSGGSVGVVTSSTAGTVSLSVGVPAATTSSYAGTLTDGSGDLCLIVDGAGTLILSGSNSYSGGTDVEQGTLCLQDAAALPLNSNLIVGSGGVLIFDPATSAAPQVHSAPGVAVAPVPEPGTLALLTAALWSAAACRRFFKRPVPRQTGLLPF